MLGSDFHEFASQTLNVALPPPLPCLFEDLQLQKNHSDRHAFKQPTKKARNPQKQTCRNSRNFQKHPKSSLGFFGTLWWVTPTFQMTFQPSFTEIAGGKDLYHLWNARLFLPRGGELWLADSSDKIGSPEIFHYGSMGRKVYIPTWDYHKNKPWKCR